MKVAFSLIALFSSVVLVQAGGFGGPPPFTNDSPLVTGVDGSYQASARGTNLAGVFRFTYINGRQTSAASFNADIPTLLIDPYNDYVFFVDGISYRGLVQANINGSSIAGVLDNGAANVPNYFADVGEVEAEGLTTGPALAGTTTIPGTSVEVPATDAGASMAGEFSGSIETMSSNYAFSGSGLAAVTNYEVQLVTTDFAVDETSATFTYTPAIVPVGTVTKKFKFQGIRNSQSTSDVSTSSGT